MSTYHEAGSVLNIIPATIPGTVVILDQPSGKESRLPLVGWPVVVTRSQVHHDAHNGVVHAEDFIYGRHRRGAGRPGGRGLRDPPTDEWLGEDLECRVELNTSTA